MTFLEWVAKALVAFGGRRYVMSMGAGAVFTVMCWFGKLNETNYCLLIGGTIINYIGNNTYQKKQELKSP